MDSIDRLSKFTLVACDQAYWAEIGNGEQLAPYYDSTTTELNCKQPKGSESFDFLSA
jgi:hypothetical protein